MNLGDVQSFFHKRALESRAIDALIYTERFEAAFQLATEQHQSELVVILKSNSIARLRAWIKERLAGPLKFASYRQLRLRAQKENVPRWSRLDRDGLLEALEKKGYA